ncbi:hypothetical protein [Streptomyces sp. NPDC018693]|uniref:hypothetical protein n=1 Tax=unclassified Streptomyces TaxID=2593676 RepID=UPI0037B97566
MAGTEEQRDTARRTERWSVAWLLLALALWGWFLYLMIADHGPEVASGEPLCRGPLVEPDPHEAFCERDSLRQWPALLGILALASIASTVTAATTVYAKLLHRLRKADS